MRNLSRHPRILASALTVGAYCQGKLSAFPAVLVFTPLFLLSGYPESLRGRFDSAVGVATEIC